MVGKEGKLVLADRDSALINMLFIITNICSVRIVLYLIGETLRLNITNACSLPQNLSFFVSTDNIHFIYLFIFFFFQKSALRKSSEYTERKEYHTLSVKTIR